MAAVDDLIAFLRERLDEDERIANRWLHDFGDRRHWKVVGGRHLSYANGAGENVTAIDVDNVTVMFNEKIFVMGDLDGQSEHIARHDPARVLADVAAKLKIIELHGEIYRDIGWLEDGDEAYAEIPVCVLCVPKHSHYRTREDVPEGACATLRLLALPYAGHQDYREEWRP